MVDFEVTQAVHKVCPCTPNASETESKGISICIKHALQSTVLVMVRDGGHKDKIHGTYTVTS